MNTAAGRVHLAGQHAIAGTGGKAEAAVHAGVRCSFKNSVYFLGYHWGAMYGLIVQINSNIGEMIIRRFCSPLRASGVIGVLVL